MDPTLFRLGPLEIRWYGLLMGLSMAAGVAIMLWIVSRTRPRGGLNEDIVLTVVPFALLAGIIGARLVYVATNWDFYRDFLAEIPRTDHGGLSFYGAVAGGVSALYVLARRYKVDFNWLVDLFAPGLSIGIILVRIGNLINGESLGRETAFAFGRHPTQIYGSLLGVVLLVIALRQFRRGGLPNGYVFWSFVFWYSVLRVLIEETLRENPLYVVHYVNPTLGIGFLTLTQIIGVPVAIGTWLLLRRLRGRIEPPGKPVL
jgi:phosphatidylglycerol:prolipoprotein diacylglycerol transferase